MAHPKMPSRKDFTESTSWKTFRQLLANLGCCQPGVPCSPVCSLMVSVMLRLLPKWFYDLQLVTDPRCPRANRKNSAPDFSVSAQVKLPCTEQGEKGWWVSWCWLLLGQIFCSGSFPPSYSTCQFNSSSMQPLQYTTKPGFASFSCLGHARRIDPCGCILVQVHAQIQKPRFCSNGTL